MTPNSSLYEFQTFLNRCYYEVNLRNYTNSDLALKLSLYASYAIKRRNQGRMAESGQNLALALAWTLSLANRLTFQVDEPGAGAIWFYYPGVCPYCGGKPCSCGSKRAKERIQFSAKLRKYKPAEYESFAALQRLFAEIYPNNTSVGECDHLYQEMLEVQEAVSYHHGTHKRKMFHRIREELVDVVAHMFGVANTNGISLAEEVAKLYPNDQCFKCHKRVCECGYTLSTPILLRI